MIKISTKQVITIDGEDYPVLYKFPVLIPKDHMSDGEGYIIKIDDKYRSVWSYNSVHFLADSHTDDTNNYSSDVHLLSGFLADYKKAIEKVQHAFNLITGVTI